MNEQVKEQSAHALQGPHIGPQRHEVSTPLRLRVQPGNVHIEIDRAEAVLGRHSLADVRVRAPEVSRHHCRLLFESGLWRIVDLQSLNGVYVNGERVRDAVLFDGDRVRIGGCTLIVEQATPQNQADAHRMEMLKSIAQVLPRAAS